MRPALTEVRAVVQRRLSLPSALACRIVGIDGPAGSGKSTLAGALSQEIGAPVVPIDDFLSWGDLDSWWPRFEADVVVPLRGTTCAIGAATGRPTSSETGSGNGRPCHGHLSPSSKA